MTNGLMPNDVKETPNLRDHWSNKKILVVKEGVTIRPLEAKALHVMGLLLQNFEASGHLLYFGGQRMAANYYLQAFLLACTVIELLAYCENGRQNLLKDPNDALRAGFEIVGLKAVETNHNKYAAEELVALRNLAAHGQGVASVNMQKTEVSLDIELLDKFPEKLMNAFDEYYERLFESKKK